jgi:hypothetical protein
MGMDDVDTAKILYLREVEALGFQRTFEFPFGAAGDFRPGFGAAYVEIPLVEILRAPAMHLNFNLPREFPTQRIDVNSRATINLRGEFSRE